MEPARPRVPTQAELLRQVERIGFEIIDEADTADQHSAAIDACWAPAVDLIRLVSAKKRQRTLIPHLIEEADRWRERVEMIKAGDLAVVELLTKRRSEEHTSELQSLMRISYAVFCLKKKIKK